MNTLTVKTKQLRLGVWQAITLWFLKLALHIFVYLPAVFLSFFYFLYSAQSSHGLAVLPYEIISMIRELPQSENGNLLLEQCNPANNNIQVKALMKAITPDQPSPICENLVLKEVSPEDLAQSFTEIILRIYLAFLFISTPIALASIRLKLPKPLAVAITN